MHHCFPLSVSFTHICLCVFLSSSVFLPSRLPLIVIVPAIVLLFPSSAFHLFFLALLALLSLPISHYCSSPSSPLFLVSLTASSTPHGKKLFSQVSAQSSLSDSFILSTNNPFNSPCLPPHTHTSFHNL